MAEPFSPTEWEAILRLVGERGEEFGLPPRRSGSVVLGSFNIRRLGKPDNRSAGAWRLLQTICQRFDLLSIQEVQDNLDGLKELRRLAGEKYGLVASDITGSFPGDKPPPERLAFLFRWDVVARTEIASDITYDRSKVLSTLYGKRLRFWRSFDLHTGRLAEFVAGRRRTKPRIRLPDFLTFIRQPLCVSFAVQGEKGAEPYEFLAVNAHLLFGTKSEREAEFRALIAWLVHRAERVKNLYYKNFILLGDLNLNFEGVVDRRRQEIEDFLKSLNQGSLEGAGTAINFPFLDAHPGREGVFRTNARLNQTYDQIAVLRHDPRLPRPGDNEKAGEMGPDGFDYGVFNYVDLFREALGIRPLDAMDQEEKAHFFSRFEHDVSDHMPIWLRLPRPGAGPMPPSFTVLHAK